MADVIAIVILGIMNVALLVERYFFGQRTHQQMDDILKARLSQNVSEYLSAKAADKPSKEPPADNEFIPIEEASDEVFNKYLTTNEPTEG